MVGQPTPRSQMVLSFTQRGAEASYSAYRPHSGHSGLYCHNYLYSQQELRRTRDLRDTPLWPENLASWVFLKLLQPVRDLFMVYTCLRSANIFDPTNSFSSSFAHSDSSSFLTENKATNRMEESTENIKVKLCQKMLVLKIQHTPPDSH